MLRALPRFLVLTVGIFVLAVFVAEEYLSADDNEQDSDDQDDTDEPASIIDVVAGAGPFGTFHVALMNADLVDTLDGEGPFTVFAPTDDAFGELGETLDELLVEPDKLARVLEHHVVEGRLSASDLGEETTLKTLAGTTLRVKNKPTLQISDAGVVEPDIIAANGVIHGIETVLMPSDPPRKRARKKKPTRKS